MRLHQDNIPPLGASITALAAVIVIVGWVLDVEVFKSILPQWATMKFSTAVSFLLSAVLLYSVYSSQKNREMYTFVLLPLFTMVLLLVMTMQLMGSLLGVNTGIDELIIQERDSAVLSAAPGRPSIGTMIAFILIGITGLISIFRVHKSTKFMVWIGRIIALLGALALYGYATDSPSLYYYKEDLSTAMAVHTALLFIVLGVGISALKPIQSTPNETTTSTA